MILKNNSNKVIGINETSLLPGDRKECPKGYENNPVVKKYINNGTFSVEKTTKKSQKSLNPDPTGKADDSGQVDNSMNTDGTQKQDGSGENGDSGTIDADGKTDPTGKTDDSGKPVEQKKSGKADK